MVEVVEAAQPSLQPLRLTALAVAAQAVAPALLQHVGRHLWAEVQLVAKCGGKQAVVVLAWKCLQAAEKGTLETHSQSPSRFVGAAQSQTGSCWR